MWRLGLGTWFSGGIGSVRFKVGLDDLKGLFQLKWIYDFTRTERMQNSSKGQRKGPIKYLVNL